jgi:nitrogen fixation NifU-like protein
VATPEPQFDEIYREVILDHYRRPRNRGEIAGAALRVDGVNPVCGDEVRLELALHGDCIEDMAFSGQGCSISQASASMLTERLKGRTIDEASRVMTQFRAMMLDGAPPASDLGDLESLEGVAKLPVRVKCALLAWNVLQDALNQARTAA